MNITRASYIFTSRTVVTEAPRKIKRETAKFYYTEGNIRWKKENIGIVRLKGDNCGSPYLEIIDIDKNNDYLATKLAQWLAAEVNNIYFNYSSEGKMVVAKRKSIEVPDIVDIVDDILSDIDKGNNINGYGEYQSYYYSILSVDDNDLAVQVTKETDGLREDEQFYSIHVIDDINSTPCELHSCEISRESLFEMLREIRNICMEDYKKKNEQEDKVVTLEERLAIIGNKAEKDKEAAIKKEKNLQEEIAEAIENVKALGDRINALIIVANECIDKKIKFPSAYEVRDYGYNSEGCDYDFFADGIYHHVGFMYCKRGWYKTGESPYNKIAYVGIVNGGACGNWDFCVNKDEIISRHQGTGEAALPSLRDMKKFLKEFEIFETAFYKWIDSMQ